MSSVAIRRDEIYLEYMDKVTAYVRGKVANAHDVEDVVSSVFLKIYRKIDSFDEIKASLSTWIYTVTRNTVIDYYRSRKPQVRLSEEIPAEDTIGEPLLREEMLDSLAAALSLLKERDRDLIILHYYKGHTLKQIAEMMGMSYINAKVLHAKALAALRSGLDI